jgi:hypothetical protein
MRMNAGESSYDHIVNLKDGLGNVAQEVAGPSHSGQSMRSSDIGCASWSHGKLGARLTNRLNIGYQYLSQPDREAQPNSCLFAMVVPRETL